MSDIHILIVEDEKITAEDLRIQLEQLQYNVSGWARSGEDALDMARKNRPDLVIMDIVLAGQMNGIETAEKIYKELDTPVIFTTSHSDSRTLKEAETADAFAYLIKPLREGEIQSAIQIALYKHETEKRIRKSEETYRVLVEGAGQLILKVDPAGNILFINRSGAELAHLQPDDLCGRSILEMISKNDVEKCTRLIRKAVESGHPTIDQTNWTILGKQRWFDLAFYLLNENTEILVIGRDVTAEREMREKLEAAEKRYKKLFDEMPAGMYQSTLDGQIIDANQALVDMLGYRNKSDLMQLSTASTYIDTRDRERWLRLMKRDSTVNGFEVKWKRRDGSTIWVHETARAVKDKSGRLLYFEGIVEDITMRKKAEDEIQYRLTLEMLISKIASRFLQMDDLIPTVKKSLSELGKLCLADRAYLLMFDKEISCCDKIIEWWARGKTSHRSAFLKHDFKQFPFWYHLLQEKKIVRIGQIDELPKDAAAERAFLTSKEISSLLLIPVVANNRLVGAVGFDNATNSLEWGTVDASLLQVYAGILGNVFEHRCMVKTLRVSEEKFRNIFENSAIGIGLADSKGFLIEANEALSAILGRTDPAGMTGLPLFDNKYIRNADKTRLRRGEAVHFEMIYDFASASQVGRYRGPRRHSIFLDVILTPLPSLDKKKPSGYLVQVQDVSHRKQTEEALTRERDLLHALMDNIPDMIYFKDCQSRFTRINKAEAWLLGIKRPEEALGKTDFDFFTPDHAKTTLSDEKKLMAAKRPLIGKQEFLKTRSVDFFWGSATKVPLIDRKGKVTGMVGITRDISDLKTAEHELEKTAKALVKSNEELQNFAYVASHDLQEPLRMISSYLQLLKKRYHARLDTEADEFIEYAVDGAARMQRLIQDMLQYSRVNTRGKPFELVDLNQTLKIVMLQLGITIEENQAEVTIEPLPKIVADSGQMVQLFQNLIGNAIKFRNQAPPRIHVFFEKNQDETVFHIQDNGIGIDKDFHDQIFKIFRRLHSHDEYAGTGIGLSICQKIIERHGGQIWVESSPGTGSTFSFSIPRHEVPVT